MTDEEIFEALAEVVENPSPDPVMSEVLGIASSLEDFTTAFDFDLPPFASFYLSTGPVLGGEVAGYISEALATYLPDWEVPVSPDRLGLLLRLQASLRRTGQRHVADALGFETLGPWLGLYGRALARYGPMGLRPVGSLLGELAGELSEGWAAGLPHLLAVAPSNERPSSGEELATHLLSPVLSGVVMTRSWLRVRARERNLAMRIGGRGFAFRSLVAAHPRAAVELLEELVDEQSSWWGGSDAISTWWRGRLDGTRTMLVEIESELPTED